MATKTIFEYNPLEDKCPSDYEGELRYLWRKYSAGGIYQE